MIPKWFYPGLNEQDGWEINYFLNVQNLKRVGKALKKKNRFLFLNHGMENWRPGNADHPGIANAKNSGKTELNVCYRLSRRITVLFDLTFCQFRLHRVRNNRVKYFFYTERTKLQFHRNRPWNTRYLNDNLSPEQDGAQGNRTLQSFIWPDPCQ